MAEKNLENLKIKNTYERVVQRVDGAYYDGSGSLLDIASSTDIPSTSSLLTTASAEGNVLTFEKGDGSEFDVTITTASLDGYATEAFVNAATGSLLETASVSSNTITFTQGDGSTFDITVDTGSFEQVDTGSLLKTASATDNVITFTKGDASTFDVTITNSTDTGSLLETASVSLNTITFTKGDGSTFPITVDTGSGIAPGEVVDSLNGLSGSLTLATADSDTLSITETDSSTITLEALPQRRVTATVKNVSGGTLTKGTPVHATASASPPAGNVSEVVAAEAQSKFLMPATYVLNEDLDDGDEGQGVLIGFVNGIDTSTFEEGQVIYVAQNGGYTNDKPVGTNFIQNIGVVQKVDATNGSIEVIGAGRVNDVPNMGTGGKIFFSNADGSVNRVLLADQTISSSISASYAESASFATTASYAVSSSLSEETENALGVKVANGGSDNYFVVGVTSAGNNLPLFRKSAFFYNGTDDRLEANNYLANTAVYSDGKYFLGTNEIRQNTAQDGFLVYFSKFQVQGDDLGTIDGNLLITGSSFLSGSDFEVTSDTTSITSTDIEMTGAVAVDGATTIDGNTTITGSLIVSGGNVTYGDDDFTYTPTGGDEAAISITGSLAITGSATGSLTINDAEPVWTTYQSTTVFNNSNTNPNGWNSYSNFDSGLAQYYTKWVAPFKCRCRYVSLFVQGNVTEVTMEAFINVSNGTNFTTSTPDHTFTVNQSGANGTHHFDWYYDDGETFEVEAGDTIDFALASDGSTNANSCRLQIAFEKII